MAPLGRAVHKTDLLVLLCVMFLVFLSLSRMVSMVIILNTDITPYVPLRRLSLFIENNFYSLYVFLFVYFILYVPDNSYCHVGIVSPPNQIFSCARLNKLLTNISCPYLRL